MNKEDLMKLRQEHVPKGVSQLLPAMIAEAKGVVEIGRASCRERV